MRTLSQVLPLLARSAAQSGLRVDDPRLTELLNRATEELLADDDWHDSTREAVFIVYDQHVRLPPGVERMMACTVNDKPWPLRNRWYEFLESGPGSQSIHRETAGYQVIERDPSPCMRDVPLDGEGPYHLILQTEADNSANETPYVIIKGYDTDGAWVTRTEDGVSYDGEKLEFSSHTELSYKTTGTIEWSQITAVIKPVTLGHVTLWAADGETEQLLSRYRPREVNPLYTTYFLPGITRDGETPTEIVARVKVGYTPIEHDDDTLLIDHVPALTWMIRAISAGDMGDDATYVARRNIAVELLKKWSSNRRGPHRGPAISISPSFGIGNFQDVR